jgi:hypothetical protein
MKNKRTFKSLPTYGQIESGLFHKPAVSGELPTSQISDKEHKALIKVLYPKDRSKKFRR